MRDKLPQTTLRVIATQFWAFLLLVPELDSITLHENRFNLHWARGDLLVYFVGVTLFGIVILLAGTAVRLTIPRWYSAISVGAALVSLGFLSWVYLVRRSVIPLVREAMTETPLAFFVGVVIVGVSWRFGWTADKWKAALAAMALVFSPTLIVFWLNALSYSSYKTSSSPGIAKLTPIAGGPRDNVYIFIFDAWSHRLTFADGGLTSEFAQLRETEEDFYVFEEAHSPHSWTLVSIPRLIYGREDNLVVKAGRVRFREDPTRYAEALPSIFTTAREHGYRTYMVGWSMPYEALLGSSVDYVRSVPEPVMAGESSWRKLMSFYWRNAIKILPAGIVRRSPLTNRGIEICRRHVYNTERLTSLSFRILDEPHDAQFAVFHLPVPHSPFCYNRSGIKSRVEGAAVDVVVSARRQHAYVDSLIAEFVDRLRHHGKYENSTIVLTSDHTWREDPDLPQPLPEVVATRIPLLIKTARQRAGVRIYSPFSTLRLGEVLKALHRGDAYLPEIVERYPFVPAKRETAADTLPIEFAGR